MERKTHLVTTLKASGAVTETGSGSAVRIPNAGNAAAFVLDVTAAATAAGDTLDVFVQTKLDGTNWTDVVHFTQVVGNGGTKRHIAKVLAGVAETQFEQAASLSVGVRNLLGDEYRVRWAVVEADTASFTFSVTALPM